MNKHTSGEWRATTMQMDMKDWRALNAEPIDIVLRGCDVVAAVWCGDDEGGEESANARLIAAAPEILEALRKTLCELSHCASQLAHIGRKGHDGDSVSQAQQIARAAIAKATGTP